MKQFLTLILVAVLSAMAVDAEAQTVVKKRVGTYVESGNVVVAEANTTLAVDITVECERIIVGPYARYAQKYLGVRASLVDRTQYSIVSADVAVVDEADTALASLAEPSIEVDDHMGSVEAFAKLSPDKLSSNELAAEDAASSAAEQLFALRRARLDLIMGEYGEGVYGAGLESALREIDKLEQQYIELFLGKHIITRNSYRMIVPIDSERPNPIVARFSPEAGLLSCDNLAGNIVMLNIVPSNMEYPASDIKGRVGYRYANNSTVTVSVGQDELVSRVLPIYEFGATVMFLAPTK